MDMASTASIPRIDPRRPFTVTADGLKRIVLGKTGGSPSDHTPLPDADAHYKSKPLRTSARARQSLLVAVHSDRGALDEHARQAIAAAALLADAETEVLLLVFGELKDDIAALGADLAIVLTQYGSRFAPDEELTALRTVIDATQPVHIFMPDNALSDGDLGRRLAAAMTQDADAGDVSIATHAVEINAKGVAVYRDRRSLMARRALPRVVLLAADAVDARLPFVGRGESSARLAAIASAAATSTASRYRDLGIKTLAASQVALEEADFIVAAGNGVSDVAAFSTLADALDAAIGASRVAVDDGKFTRDKQIGATGKTVSASAYLAFGISGAVQHLQGIKDCRHVIAVNLDASAPMMKRADLGIVDDTHDVMQALLEEVQQARGARGTS